ncbi:DUF6482 family protein [Shewanella algidipiscicola]|uniref:Uncharacterized protein n=1 Tax=Shewanella algidipiscicola TaxID=614070 RepID=A0ABQ4P5X4_9GAMM|nr:DUF6482 family protein [Shewanella algidipiscicola]GIU42871.1 hypothetical protein TUM4630_04850 [Shewanella algidipiscicola]
MTQDELIELFKAKHLSPTIINTADATHYLVGGEDPQGNFYQLTYDDLSPMQYQSLEQAKVQLKQMGVCKATFELYTAYDEMIGVTPQHDNKTSIELSL